MPRTRSASWQHALGGAVGVVALAFALTFHFFPHLLNVSPQQPLINPTGTNPSPAAASSSPLSYAGAPISAGPPVSLAPEAVLKRREQARLAAAVAAIKARPKARRTGKSADVDKLLKRAARALATGNLADGESSAASLYGQALKSDPDSRTAVTGLAKVHIDLVTATERLLDAGELDAAAHDLTVLSRIPGSHEDVARLGARLARLHKIHPVLARAAALLQQGHLLKPPDNNALALYRRVLTADPDNAIARHGLLRVQRHVLDQALAALAQSDFAAADAELASAAQIAPGSAALAQARGRVATAREHAAEGVLAQARSALDAGNLALAGKLRTQALALNAKVKGLEAFDASMHDAKVYAGFHPGQTFTDRFLDLNGHGPTMVVIPTGSFLMGSSANSPGHTPDESPRHAVDLSQGFAMARDEVTVAEFRRFVAASGYVPDSVRLGGADVYDSHTGVMRHNDRATWRDDFEGHSAAGDLPVVNVSWNDAAAYAHWLAQRTGEDYQLPSEAQFAYALRAGTTTRYWWGDGTPKNKVENITGSRDRSRHGRHWTHAFSGYGDGHWGPAAVGSFAANPFGLYDMDGNVSEWVDDCWHDNYTRAPTNGSAWINAGCTERVVRGGSWGSGPDEVRSAWRHGVLAITRSGRIGFRVVRVF